jgi:hypothetical protein
MPGQNAELQMTSSLFFFSKQCQTYAQHSCVFVVSSISPTLFFTRVVLAILCSLRASPRLTLLVSDLSIHPFLLCTLSQRSSAHGMPAKAKKPKAAATAAVAPSGGLRLVTLASEDGGFALNRVIRFDATQCVVRDMDGSSEAKAVPWSQVRLLTPVTGGHALHLCALQS